VNEVALTREIVNHTVRRLPSPRIRKGAGGEGRRKKLFVFLLLCALVSTHIAPVAAQQVQEIPSNDVYLPASPDEISKLRQKLREAEARAAKNKISNPQNLALWKFKLEQARLLLNEMDALYGPPNLAAQKSLEKFLARAEEVEKSSGDAAVSNSQPHERAYTAANDGSAQPYWVFLPKNYSAKKKYPLIVFLHGYLPQITKLRPWIPGAPTWSLAINRGFIFVVPYGRRNSDFLQIGQDDTLRVLEETQKLYSTDANRTFLMGASMGGYGTLAVGLQTPHLWAGLAPMAARTDIYKWLRLNRDEVLPWKRALYESDDPKSLAANAQHLPIFLQHGANDHLISVEHSRDFYNQLKSLNYAVRYREIPNGDHYIYLTDNAFVQAFDWAQKLKRRPAPRKFVYVTQNLQNHRAYWATIEAFEKYGEPAKLEVNLNGDSIEVQTQNIAALKLEPPREFKLKTVKLRINGSDAGTFDASKAVVWSTRKAVENEFPGLKNPQRSGPIREVYRGPFLLVYGDETDKSNAERWAREWNKYADGTPPIKADKEVSPLERKNFNLILFGTRDTNSIVKELPQLLVELTAKGYRVGTSEYSKENVGLVMCYPSPWSRERMIVIQSGLFWGSALPLNHKFDLLPDYIVFDDSFDTSDNTNRALAAGYFDNQWQLEPSKN
jgi:predicted peptidase